MGIAPLTPTTPRPAGDVLSRNRTAAGDVDSDTSSINTTSTGEEDPGDLDFPSRSDLTDTTTDDVTTTTDLTDEDGDTDSPTTTTDEDDTSTDDDDDFVDISRKPKGRVVIRRHQSPAQQRRTSRPRSCYGDLAVCGCRRPLQRAACDGMSPFLGVEFDGRSNPLLHDVCRPTRQFLHNRADNILLVAQYWIPGYGWTTSPSGFGFYPLTVDEDSHVLTRPDPTSVASPDVISCCASRYPLSTRNITSVLPIQIPGFDHKIVACTSFSSSVVLYDAEADAVVGRLVGCRTASYSLTFLPQSRLFVGGDSTAGLFLWKFDEGFRNYGWERWGTRVQSGPNWVFAMHSREELWPNRFFFAVGDGLHCCDLEKRELTASVFGDEVASLDTNRGGSLLLKASRQTNVATFFDPRNLKRVGSHSVHGSPRLRSVFSSREREHLGVVVGSGGFSVVDDRDLKSSVFTCPAEVDLTVNPFQRGFRSAVEIDRFRFAVSCRKVISVYSYDDGRKLQTTSVPGRDAAESKWGYDGPMAFLSNRECVLNPLVSEHERLFFLLKKNEVILVLPIIVCINARMSVPRCFLLGDCAPKDARKY